MRKTLLLALPTMVPGVCRAAEAVAPQGAADGAHMTHRMMMLMLQLGVILFAARIGSILLERVRMPGVLGELLAGVLIGPFLLGGLPLPGFPHGLFPIGEGFPLSPELYGICSLAAIVLLFLVGLETDIKLFLRYSVAGGLVGVGGVAASFILGDALCSVFSPSLFGQRYGFMAPPCLFLGIISTATSVGITARILAEQKKVDSPEGVTVLAGAVIDDVLGIILLAVGLGVITASGTTGSLDWAHVGLVAAKAGGVWLGATAIGLAASHRISLLLKCFGDRSAIAVMALGLALILAGLFEEAGLAMIVGAYVMGLSLSRTDVSHVVREHLSPIAAFLVPVFFTAMGMLVNVRVLMSREVLAFGLLYTLVADVAKVVGCGGPALLCGFNLRGAARIGFGMLPRGEVTLIIAGVGLAAGVLTPQLFGVVVMMIFVTALIAPPTLVALFRHPGSGMRRGAPAEEERVLSFDFPSVQTADLLVAELLDVFETEGFFVHTLSRRARIFQLRKETVIIGMRQRDASIDFECSESEVPFVSTAMIEVVAELEQTVRELRKPVDRRAIAAKAQVSPNGRRSGASLAPYLSSDALAPRLRGTTKADVTDELLELIGRTGVVSDAAEARRAVLAREEAMSTGMQFGVALPHAKTSAVDRIVCAVGLKPEGVDFDAMDGGPSTIFVLGLSPEGAGTPHLEFMATVNQVLDERRREDLLACRTAEGMYRLLAGDQQRGPDTE